MGFSGEDFVKEACVFFCPVKFEICIFKLLTCFVRNLSVVHYSLSLKFVCGKILLNKCLR